MKNKDKFTLAVDFDGTLNSYESGFISPSEIPDPPVKGAKEALDLLSKHFDIVIFSVRAETKEGKKAIEDYMEKHKLPFREVTDRKPSGLIIDDNCLTFKGSWPKMVKEIASFTHWKDNKNVTKNNKHNR